MMILLGVLIGIDVMMNFALICVLSAIFSQVREIKESKDSQG